MSRYEHFPKASNPVHQEIYEEIYDNNGIAHGSPVRGLEVLEPHISSSLSVYTPTGEPLTNPEVVWGTLVPEAATFYATVHAVTREPFWLPEDDQTLAGRQLYRASAVRPIREEGHIVGHEYFASDAAKELIQRRLDEGIESEVYFGDRREFRLVRTDSAEWIAQRKVHVRRSLAVTALHLPFDFFSLPSPNSDEQIRGFNDEAGKPDETKSLATAPFARAA